MCLWETGSMTLHVWDKLAFDFKTSLWNANLAFVSYEDFTLRHSDLVLPDHANYKQAKIAMNKGLLVLNRLDTKGIVELVAHGQVRLLPDFKAIKKPGKMTAQARWDKRPTTGDLR